MIEYELDNEYDPLTIERIREKIFLKYDQMNEQ